MFGKDDTLMWGGGKTTQFFEATMHPSGPTVDVIMPSPEVVPEHVLDIIRPLLITYGAGGSAEAEDLRKSITRWGYGDAIPEWFNEANYTGHVPKQVFAHLIYEMFYYAVVNGPIERETTIPVTKGRIKHLVLKLGNHVKDHYVHIAKGRRETIDGVNTDVFDFPITKQINRHELPEPIREAFKKQAISVSVDGVTERDGKLHPIGFTQLNLKTGQEQIIFHSLEIMPAIASHVLQTNTSIESTLLKQPT